MENASIFVGDLTQEQAERLGPALEEVRDWLNSKMRTGRCSSGLVVDLARHLVMSTLDVFAIYDEIAALEHPEAQIVGTKIVSKFKHPPLVGLSYKHYFRVDSIIKNLEIELRRGKTVEKFLRPRMGQVMTERMINELTQEVVIKNFHRRSTDGRLTGEWLIFEESSGGNYYLTLGTHGEGDKNIYARVLHYKLVDAEIARREAHSGPPLENS